MAVSGGGRMTVASDASCRASSSSRSAPGSFGRAPTTIATGSSGTRRARKSRKRRLGASLQCASSTSSSSGVSSARPAVSQYRPCSTANEVSATGVAVPSADRGPRLRRGADEQLVAARMRQDEALEELAHDAERELALELAARGLQRPEVGLCAERVEQRGLAGARGALDERDPAEPAAGGVQQRGQRPQLVLALQQPHPARRLGGRGGGFTPERVPPPAGSGNGCRVWSTRCRA